MSHPDVGLRIAPNTENFKQRIAKRRPDEVAVPHGTHSPVAEWRSAPVE